MGILGGKNTGFPIILKSANRKKTLLSSEDSMSKLMASVLSYFPKKKTVPYVADYSVRYYQN